MAYVYLMTDKTVSPFTDAPLVLSIDTGFDSVSCMKESYESGHSGSMTFLANGNVVYRVFVNSTGQL